MAIIAISGRKSSGKNLVASIIQYLTCDKGLKVCTYQEWIKYKCAQTSTPWGQRQFANKLKDIVCLLIGCSWGHLEHEDFKSKELPEQWWVWKLEREGGYSTILLPYLTTTKKELENYSGLVLVKPTVRSLLQEVGTDLFRNLIHPDIWINSLFNDYKTKVIPNKNYSSNISEPKNWIITKEERDEYLLDNSHLVYKHEVDVIIPSWIITDLRFKNELKAVKDRDGITIRVNREFCPRCKESCYSNKINEVGENYIECDNCNYSEWGHNGFEDDSIHISETELDNETFDYVIDNNSDIEDLIIKVKKILILEKLL